MAEDNIERRITKVDKAIENLQTRIGKLQKQMQSGNFGTDQLKQLQGQIDRLTTSLKSGEGIKLRLIDERQVAQATKAIDNIKGKLDRLRAQQKDANIRLLPQDPETFNKINTDLERQIRKYETTIKGFQTRIQGLQNKSFYAKNPVPDIGTRLTQSTQSSNLDKDTAERFLNKRLLGAYLTNEEVSAKIAESRRTAARILGISPATAGGNPNVAGGSPDQVSVGSLPPAQSIIPKYATKDIRAAQQKQVDILKKEVDLLEKDYIKAEQGAKRAEQIREREVKAAEANAKREEKSYTRAEQDAKREDQTREREQRAHERSAKAAEAKARDEQRVADARRLVANDPRYKNALLRAQRAGMGVDDLQGIEDRTGGVQRLNFAQQRGGINYKLPIYSSQGGGATPGLSSQFRSFGSDIARDIGQFTKWSIAVAAVYTPLAKLSELMQIMVENESRLADATIAANIPFERSGEIFDQVAIASEKSGEAITGVIDAYAQAFRAAGRYTDESEKTAKATVLLNDSLVLSKLSSLDQAGAIDTLSAALLQAGLELDQGDKLLNKWVRVSQIANVDIATLATGVAVLGDAAETSGLSIDQLNGLIAVLAEQSISGSKEAANTAKALIGAYQSDKAEAALNQYGIALRKANGEVRQFLDVYKDVAKLRDEGILSDAAVSELALALGGGGTRRAKDASALINSQERLNNIARESGDITDESTLAQDSLAKKLETVQTATTRLANAWQELAQTLGDDGGLLDLLKGSINAFTGITKAADDFFTLLGRSGPVLATFTTALLTLSAISEGRKLTFLQGLGAAGAANFGASLRNDVAGVRQQGVGGFGRGILGDITRLNARGGTVLGGAATIGMAASNLQAGRNEQAIANVVGGLIGAAIGGTLSGGIGIAAGAAIGSSIGDTLMSTVLNYRPQWEQLFTDIFKPIVTTVPGEQGAPAVSGTPEYREELLKEVRDTSPIGDTLARILANQFKNVPDFLLNAVAKRSGLEFTGENVSAVQIQRAFAPKDLQARIGLEEETRKLRAGEILPDEKTPQYERQRVELEQQATAERQRQLQRLAEGEIKPAEFGRISKQLTGFPSTAIQSTEAYGQAFIDASSNVNNLKDAYEEFLFISTNGTQDQINQLTSYTTDIRILQNYIDKWEPGLKGMELALTFGNVKVESPEQLRKLLEGLQTESATAATRIATDIRLQDLKLPAVAGSYTEPIAKQDEQKIIEEGLRIQQQYYEDVGASADEIKHLVSNIEAFSVFTEDAGRSFFDTVEGLNQWAYDAAKKSLEELGKIASEQKGIGFQQYDVPISQLEQLASQSLQIGQGWQDKFNYDFSPEDQIAIDNQGIVQPLHADFKILALLLEKIVDQNQKQLDGQYNIPEGATFWVPLTAAYYRNKEGGAGGGIQSMLDSLAVDTNTSATDRNTSAVQQLSDKFMMKNLGPELYGRTNQPATNTGYGPQYTTRGQEFIRQRADPKYAQIIGEKDYDPGTIGGRYSPRATTATAPTAQGTNIQSILESIKNIFQNFFSTSGGQYKEIGPRPASSGGFGNTGSRGVQNATPQLSTKLDLRLSSNVNLLVDGRLLASTLQNYLASELLRTEASQGTITKRYVI